MTNGIKDGVAGLMFVMLFMMGVSFLVYGSPWFFAGAEYNYYKAECYFLKKNCDQVQ